MNFVKLTKPSGKAVYVNLARIERIEPVDEGSLLFTGKTLKERHEEHTEFTPETFLVTESPQEILGGDRFGKGS